MAEQHIAIAGAGLVGRLLALRLRGAGHRVTLVDRDAPPGHGSCTWVGAGMLAPYCELQAAEPVVCRLGLRGLAAWPALLAELPQAVWFQRQGSLVVAHPRDAGELARLEAEVRNKLADDAGDAMQKVNARTLGELEPQLAGRFQQGLYFPHEGQIGNRSLLAALAEALRAAAVPWYAGVAVRSVAPGRVELSDGSAIHCDWAVDARGMGARDALRGLRGVRGELLRLSAPEVALRRPVRLMHPRYPLYVVPRADHFVVGATQIESEDDSPVSVRSLLELLSAAYALHPAFAEARVLETAVQRRPAFADNLPRLEVGDGILRVNGLFRHGFLLAPALVAGAEQVIAAEPLDADLRSLTETV